MRIGFLLEVTFPFLKVPLNPKLWFEVSLLLKVKVDRLKFPLLFIVVLGLLGF